MPSGAAATVNCPKCRGALTGALCNLPEPVPCPACNATILVEVFPAFFRSPVTGQTAETLIEEDAASCFYHEHKKAVTHCEACGRFLCALCDVDLGGQHLCPTCLQAGKRKGKLATFDTTRTLWDTSALVVCLAPVIIWPVVVVTAPIAITLAIVSFFKPGSIVPRTRLRALLAIALSVIELLGWYYTFFIVES